MIGFTFSLEQIRSAPPEVRHWIEREVAASLAPIAAPRRDAPVHAPSLVACVPDEATQLYELIKGDFLLSQVFVELGRETPDTNAATPLHAIAVVDLLRHTRLGGVERLAEYFGAIDQAFRALRDDPTATLFAFDQQGHVYIHEATLPQHPPFVGTTCGSFLLAGRCWTRCRWADASAVHAAAFGGRARRWRRTSRSPVISHERGRCAIRLSWNCA